jgi:regulator of sigma E protease
MSDFLISFASVVVVLGFMILIHEFGHFAVAKWLGVRVEQFAIGFGKRLVGFRRGETDYRINALPLGGYVKMSGENPMDAATDDPREFMNHPRWHRFLIAIAGPAMNVLLAVTLLTIVYMLPHETFAYLSKPAVIQGIKKDSPAAQAGLLPGDRIVKVEDSGNPTLENPTWEQLQPRVWLSPKQPLTVTVQRGSELIRKSVVPVPVTSNEIGSAGWYPEAPVVIGTMEHNSPAEKAGLRQDDKIVSLNGQPLYSIETMIESLQETKDQPVDLTVQRSGQTMQFHVQPVLASTEDPKERRWRLGFLNKGETEVSQLPFSQAFALSLEQNRKNSLLLVELAKRIAQRRVSLKAVSGPIGIAQEAGYAAQQKGWTPLMELSSGISLNLGIFNLLPIPILDGGVILFLLIESLMRRDINLRIKERVYQAAFVFLILFAAVVLFNDLVKTIPGLAERLP